jgi:hypothetical protein
MRKERRRGDKYDGGYGGSDSEDEQCGLLGTVGCGPEGDIIPVFQETNTAAGARRSGESTRVIKKRHSQDYVAQNKTESAD